MLSFFLDKLIVDPVCCPALTNFSTSLRSSVLSLILKPGIASLKRDIDTTWEILQRCAKLEHAVAVVFERGLFSTKDCMRPCTESMKRRADDVRVESGHARLARIALPFMWGSPQLCTCKVRPIF